jgi:hypothetical protein
MATDPFVAPPLGDLPRQEPNLAPGVHMPPARRWVPDRPGDEVAFGQPRGHLFGSPGPNIGYALTLARRMEGQFTLAPHEHPADVRAVVAELAMKRAASYGRAPVITDLECAALVLGYLGGASPEFAKWREVIAEHAHENYFRRRAVCDAVDLDVIRLAPQALSTRLPDVRDAVRRAHEAAAAAEEPRGHH